MIEYLGYFPIRVITKIQLPKFMKRKIQINILFTQLKVSIKELMFFFIWNYMAWKIDIKEKVYKLLIRENEQEKIRYDREVKIQYFTLVNFILFKSPIFYLKKLIEQ